MEEIVYSQAVPSDEIEIKSILAQCRLLTDDITPHLANFVVARVNSKIVGVIGLEACGESGLLRSLAVKPELRLRGIAMVLHTHIFARARLLNIKELYLLTNTAFGYAFRLGFNTINREDVAKSIQATAQFQSLCPITSTCMKMSIK